MQVLSGIQSGFMFTCPFNKSRLQSTNYYSLHPLGYRQWRGTTVRANCDNEAIVAAINSGYLQNSFLMHFLRCIFVLLVILENVEHCGGEPEQASTMATHK